MGANAGRDVAVIGGGIAGLTAALAFRQTGAQVRVYEQAAEPTEVGAGIQITPNGVRALEALGLAEALAAHSLVNRAVVPIDAHSGRTLARFDLTKRAGAAYRLVYRPDLIDLLSKACREAKIEIHGNARAVDVSQNGTVSLENGNTVRAELVLGADGLHSKVRRRLNGDNGPFFTGQVAWRAMIDAPEERAEARIWMAKGRHVAMYPVPGNRLNIVAVQERSDWAAEGWNHSDDPENLRAAFADCAAPLRAVLDQVAGVNLWGLFRHEVATNWVGSHIALLGDAAHPTLPFLAQGANLAIEDAYVLAKSCNGDVSIARGLQKYQATRRPRAMRAIAAANANARKYHLAGLSRHIGHLGLRTIGLAAPNAFLNRLNWLYDHDVTL